MIKLSLPVTTLALAVVWLIFLFTKLPHLIFHPGVLFSWFISEGLIFYRDFVNPHFPFATFFIYPFFLLSNWNLEIEPIISVILSIFTLVAIYLIIIRFLSKTAVTVSLLFFAILFYYFSTAIQYNLETVIGLLVAILIYRISSYLNVGKLTAFGLFLDGVLIGAAELTGQIATAILGVMFLVITYQALFKKSRPALRWRFGVIFLAGIFIPFLLISLYFIKNNAFTDFFNINIPYYFTYLKLARVGSPLENLPWKDILLFYAPLVANLPLIFDKNNKKLRLVLMLMAIVSIPSIIFSVFHPHHFLFVLPILTILTGFAFDGLKTKLNFRKLIIIFSFLYIIYHISTSILPWYWERITAPPKYRIANAVWPGTSMYQATEWVKNNTKKADRILVAGDGMFYFSSQRLPSTNRQAVLPWHYKPINQTSLIIQETRPDYWIIDTNYLERLSASWGWNSPEITEFIKDELNSCYQKTVTFSEWEIWGKFCR